MVISSGHRASSCSGAVPQHEQLPTATTIHALASLVKATLHLAYWGGHRDDWSISTLIGACYLILVRCKAPIREGGQISRVESAHMRRDECSSIGQREAGYKSLLIR